MAKKLVIMESPTKTKAVQKYLGNDYNVLSCDGHITNLATKGEFYLGVDLKTFEPSYKIERKKKLVVKKLQDALLKCDEVLLATDPDREGEAIAYHLREVLKINDYSKRVSFNEITEDVVKAAFKNPRELDMNLVRSQETRRILDRFIGFRLSKLLQKKIRSKSAGRVQSVALKLIVIREREHQEFISQEYWSIEAYYKKHILKLTKFEDQAITINNGAEARHIIANLNSEFVVKNVQEKTKMRNSNNPYTTSTMFQDASSRLNFASNKTSLLAQQLYEGIDINGTLTGFITYPRTDSIRLSEKFVENVFQYIKTEFGSQYLGTVKISKKKSNVQDAHEAIRPTNIDITPEKAKQYLNRDQLRLYKLIYSRALASLTAPAKLMQKTIIFNNNGYQFRLNGQTIVFDGFLKFYQDDEDNNESIKLPNFKANQVVKINEIKPLQHFTKPKPRYTEAKLIKTLEELGVGRPSTYAPIMRTLRDRGYVLLENKSLKASDRGILTNDKLQQFFKDIIDEKYTSMIEEHLDYIAHGREDHKELLKSFWEKFEPRVEEAFEKMEVVEVEKTGDECPQCTQDLVYRYGRYGKFIGCSGFPKCRFVRSVVQIDLGICPDCENGQLVIKFNRRSQKFIACTNYPECTYIDSYIELKQEATTEAQSDNIIDDDEK